MDPERRLTPEIIGLTGITDEMLRGAPKLKDALTKIINEGANGLICLLL